MTSEAQKAWEAPVREARKRRAAALLLLMRCGYCSVDGHELTWKGRGLLPRWVYRAYLRVKCRLDPKFRAALKDLLEPREVRFEARAGRK